MTNAERKAGKHERIRMLLNNIIKPQPKPIGDVLGRDGQYAGGKLVGEVASFNACLKG